MGVWRWLSAAESPMRDARSNASRPVAPRRVERPDRLPRRAQGATFGAPHASALAGLVMVVSCEMEGAVDHEPRQLAAEADPVAPRLLDRALHGDHEISGHSVLG